MTTTAGRTEALVASIHAAFTDKHARQLRDEIHTLESVLEHFGYGHCPECGGTGMVWCDEPCGPEWNDGGYEPVYDEVPCEADGCFLGWVRG